MSTIFKNLPKELYMDGWLPELIPCRPEQELIVMNKLGGCQPFLQLDETWPLDENSQHMTFIGQFAHSTITNGQLVRFFLNVNNLDDYQFDIVDIHQPYQISVLPPTSICLPCQTISNWYPICELMDLISICNYYLKHLDQFQNDFKSELTTIDNPNIDLKDSQFKSIIYQLVNEEYLFANNIAQPCTLKVGGTPYSDEGRTRNYLDEGLFLQMCSTFEYPLPFSVGQIMSDNLNFTYE